MSWKAQVSLMTPGWPAFGFGRGRGAASCWRSMRPAPSSEARLGEADARIVLSLGELGSIGCPLFLRGIGGRPLPRMGDLGDDPAAGADSRLSASTSTVA